MQSDNEMLSVNRKYFLKNHSQTVLEELFPDPFLKYKFEHIFESMV